MADRRSFLAALLSLPVLRRFAPKPPPPGVEFHGHRIPFAVHREPLHRAPLWQPELPEWAPRDCPCGRGPRGELLAQKVYAGLAHTPARLMGVRFMHPDGVVCYLEPTGSATGRLHQRWLTFNMNDGTVSHYRKGLTPPHPKP